MDDIKLAAYMHERYEDFAREANWKTQKKCRVPFSKLPKENQTVMIKMAHDLNRQFASHEELAFTTIADQANKLTEYAKATEILLSIMPRKHLIKALAELHDRRFREKFK